MPAFKTAQLTLAQLKSDLQMLLQHAASEDLLEEARSSIATALLALSGHEVPPNVDDRDAIVQAVHWQKLRRECQELFKTSEAPASLQRSMFKAPGELFISIINSGYDPEVT